MDIVCGPEEQVKEATGNVGNFEKMVCIASTYDLNALKFEDGFKKSEKLACFAYLFRNKEKVYADLLGRAQVVPAAVLCVILEKFDYLVFTLVRLTQKTERLHQTVLLLCRSNFNFLFFLLLQFVSAIIWVLRLNFYIWLGFNNISAFLCSLQNSQLLTV